MQGSRFEGCVKIHWGDREILSRQDLRPDGRACQIARHATNFVIPKTLPPSAALHANFARIHEQLDRIETRLGELTTRVEGDRPRSHGDGGATTPDAVTPQEYGPPD